MYKKMEHKERIGIMPQSTTLYPDLKVGEILKLFAGEFNFGRFSRQ